jgi:hypothetical protein
MKRLASLSVALLVVVGVASAQGTAASQKTMNARGVVKSVSGSSLVITSNNKDMTFEIDNTTRIVGKGLGTKNEAAKAAGKKLVITDAVHEKDNVQVSYHDMSGKLHAAEVRVR